MNNFTILPADSYIVVNKTIITEIDKNIINMLYQPIIGYTAVSLYLTLLNDLDKMLVMSGEYTHHHLMSIMQLNLDSIIKAREKLEAIGLLKSYMKKGSINHYVYLLYSPLPANEFFNHPLLNIILYNNLGKEEYEKLLNFYKIPRLNLKEYEDITKNFTDIFKVIPKSSNIELPDIAKQTTNKLSIIETIDFNLLIASLPQNTYNERCFNKDTKDLINMLALTYNIDDFKMQSLVLESLNEKGLIDKNNLRKNCRNYYQYENEGNLPTIIHNIQPTYLKKPEGDHSKWAKMVYTFENTSPYKFLKAQYKGGKPTARDLKIVEELMIEQHLNPGIVNVLLSYVLKVNNQRLNKSYIETIVGQWKRLKVETVEDAMHLTEKEHKKIKKMMESKKEKKSIYYKQKNKEESLPEWFDKEMEKENISKEEQEELNNLLENLT